MTQLGGRFDRCPKAWLRDDASEEAELIGDVMAFREHHIAPCAGGLLDQPPLWVEALGVVDEQIAKIKGAADGG